MSELGHSPSCFTAALAVPANAVTARSAAAVCPVPILIVRLALAAWSSPLVPAFTVAVSVGQAHDIAGRGSRRVTATPDVTRSTAHTHIADVHAPPSPCWNTCSPL